MSDGASGGGGGNVAPFENSGTLSSLGNAVANEGSEFIGTAKKQLGLGGKPKSFPQNLAQTQKIKALQKSQQLSEGDQKEIARLTQEVHEMIRGAHDQVQTTSERIVDEERQKQQQQKMEELEEEKEKAEQKVRAFAGAVALPGSTPKGPGVPGKQKAQTNLSNIAVTQAVNKDLGRQAKG